MNFKRIKSKKIFVYLFGYLQRPYLWFDFIRQPWRLLMLLRPREKSKSTATAWATNRAISTRKALSHLTEGNMTDLDLARNHSDELQRARKRFDQIPGPIGRAGNITFLYAMTRWLQPLAVVETGVAAGWSSLAILLALSDNGKGRLISCDRPDMRLPDDKYVGSVVPTELYERWTLLLGVDKDELPRALSMAGEHLTLVHYDSDKSYFGRAWAYPRIWSALAAGGVMVSDDISDNTGFMDFCSSHGIDSVVISQNNGFVGIAKKSPVSE